MTKKKKKRKIQYRFEYLLFQIFYFLVKLIPFNMGCWIGERLSLLAFYILPGRRKLTIENIRLARANGYLNIKDSDNYLARKVWKHLGRVGSESLYFYSHPKLLLNSISITGRNFLEQALSKKKGAILVMSHIGNWELLGMALVLTGYPLCPLVKNQSNKLVDEIIQTQRQSVGMKVVSRAGFLRPVVEALKRNEVVPFLIDQAYRRKGVIVDFFGRPARIPRGPAEFALKTGAPVLFAYLIRETNHSYHLVISEEITLTKSGNYENDLENATIRFCSLIQSTISKYPEQWLWMHRLWRPLKQTSS